LTRETGPEGTIQFNDLSSGNYNLSVEKLGITAAYICLHVSKWSTGLSAKRALTFDWGNDAPETRRIAGRLVAGNVIYDGRPIQIPVAGNRLTLHDALTDGSFETETDANGLFAFNGLASGIYVLHAHQAKQSFSRADYAAGDVLIRLNPTARRETLTVQRNSGGGDCSGPVVLQNEP
jgi:hypothetical protein